MSGLAKTWADGLKYLADCQHTANYSQCLSRLCDQQAQRLLSKTDWLGVILIEIELEQAPFVFF